MCIFTLVHATCQTPESEQNSDVGVLSFIVSPGPGPPTSPPTAPADPVALAIGIIQNSTMPKIEVSLKNKVFIKKGLNLEFPSSGKGHHSKA
jgi:hypothetical protein